MLKFHLLSYGTTELWSNHCELSSLFGKDIAVSAAMKIVHRNELEVVTGKVPYKQR